MCTSLYAASLHHLHSENLYYHTRKMKQSSLHPFLYAEKRFGVTMNPTSYRSALPHESHLLKQNVVEFLKSIKFYNISAYIAGKADIKMMQCCKF